MKWGVRRYQNEDGTLTDAGRKRYAKYESKIEKTRTNKSKLEAKLEKQESNPKTIKAYNKLADAAKLRSKEYGVFTSDKKAEKLEAKAKRLEAGANKVISKVNSTKSEIDKANALISKYNRKIVSKFTPEQIAEGKAYYQRIVADKNK